MAKSLKRPPWKRSNPRKKAGKASKHLSPAKKKAAKASAKRAGRPYPNLVDNMRAASKKKTAKKKAVTKKSKAKASSKKSANKSAKKKSAGKKVKKRVSSTMSAKKDPQGGLTAAGRRAFAKDGLHLKPGVRKSMSDMSPSDMRRKGSWAMRFYGRAKLPPLVDAKGKPTRHALSAHAWGEPVPKTVAATRRIAAKGKRLLEHYHLMKAK